MTVAIVSPLRRENSSDTSAAVRDAETGPSRAITVASPSVITSAAIARVKNGRSVDNRHTMPNAPASKRLHPRARLLNAPIVPGGCTVSTTAIATHAIAKNARPPAHHPTSAHAATAGTKSSIVCSIGRTARTYGVSGRNTNAASARKSFPQPRSDGAGAGTGAEASVTGGETSAGWFGAGSVIS